jgi:adenylosuccinate synthase
MKADVLLGLQWGDEGKGKIVDVLTPNYQVIARFQGGPNAGHTLEFNGIKHVLHTIPSGIFRPDAVNVIGNGVVIDPVILMKEITALRNMGVNMKESLRISKKAHLILPTHKVLDAASEAQKGTSKIGSTLKGIGPTYMDKTGRNGLRIGDIFLDTFKSKYETLVAKHKELVRFYNFEYDITNAEKEWFAAIDEIKQLEIIDSEIYLNETMKEGKRVLCEGAQGSLLDVDFGTYPFVTSSNTTCAGACTGLGIAPNKIENVFGIFTYEIRNSKLTSKNQFMKILQVWSFKWNSSIKHSVQNYSSTPNIRLKSFIAFSFENFRSYISWSAALFMHYVTWIYKLTNTKICYFNFTFSI